MAAGGGTSSPHRFCREEVEERHDDLYHIRTHIHGIGALQVHSSDLACSSRRGEAHGLHVKTGCGGVLLYEEIINQFIDFFVI